MFPEIIRHVFKFAMPGAVLLLFSLVARYQPETNAKILPLLPYYPGFVMLTGILLGWRFNRMRLAYGVLVIVITAYALQTLPAMILTLDGRPIFLQYLLYSILLFNLAFLGFIKDRSLFCMRSLTIFILIPVQAIFVYIFQLHYPDLLAALTSRTFKIFSLSIPSVYLITGSGVLVFLPVQYLRKSQVMNNGLFWAALTVLFAALHPGKNADTRLLLSTSGLILIASLLESSYRMAFQDELTGLPARRALNEKMGELANQYTIAMVDIDHFKIFNDKYGHDIGDEVLRKIATHLRTVGSGGKAYRYGGEEFSILFPGKMKTEVIEEVEALRRNIARSGFVVRSSGRPKKKTSGEKRRASGTGHKGRKVTLTVSIGLAEKTDKLQNAAEVIKAADKALYKAKKAGRNQTCSA